MDAGGLIVFPKGNYKITSTLYIRSDNTIIIGHGPSITTLLYVGTGPLITNASANNKTHYWCQLSDIRMVVKNKNYTGPIIDWSSMQFGTLQNIWISGPGTENSIGINLSAAPKHTDATYNIISHALIGLVNIGIQFAQGANSNTVQFTRFQPMPGGVGIYLKANVNNNHILNNGFEYPNHVSGGIMIGENVTNTSIEGNRFEGLAYAWKITQHSNKDTVVLGNYYSSITESNKWDDQGTKTRNFDKNKGSSLDN